jgi:glycosyltransferase involved in cell wall biosynthesis
VTTQQLDGHLKEEIRNEHCVLKTSIEAQDKRLWSGIYYHMAQVLQEDCGPLIHPSYVGSFGAGVLESMTVGFPVVAHNGTEGKRLWVANEVEVVTAKNRC